MSQPSVSIITAVRNGASTIARTIESVAGQDHPNIEHLIIDGKSDDGTLAAIAELHISGVSVESEPDSGVYDAFNKGLRRSRGDIIAFLNCGDTYKSPHSISTMVEALSNVEIDASFADLLIVSDDGAVIRKYSSKHFRPSVMRFGFMPAHPTLFMRREVYERIGPYRTDLRIAADFELCLRAFVKAGVRYSYVREEIVCMPTGGISNRGLMSKLSITEEMAQACRLNNVHTSHFKLSLRLAVKLFELRLFAN